MNFPHDSARTGRFICGLHLSAPPLKLKRNGWLGNYALGASYIALPWWQVMLVLATLNWQIAILTLFTAWRGWGCCGK
jgi:chlorophyll synthase